VQEMKLVLNFANLIHHCRGRCLWRRRAYSYLPVKLLASCVLVEAAAIRGRFLSRLRNWTFWFHCINIFLRAVDNNPRANAGCASQAADERMLALQC
jgi:hypothetical protein